jgi:hypothetical protein
MIFELEALGRKFQVERLDDGSFVIPDEIRQMLTQGSALKPAYEPIDFYAAPKFAPKRPECYLKCLTNLRIDE